MKSAATGVGLFDVKTASNGVKPPHKIDFEAEARAACLYVRYVCVYGSGNNETSVGQISEAKSYAATFAAQDERNAKIKSAFGDKTGNVKQASSFEDHCDIIKTFAETTFHHRAGNCADRAALAMKFLLTRNVYPIELVTTDSHTVLILGKTGSIKDPKTYADDAIVCDPWILCEAFDFDMSKCIHKAKELNPQFYAQLSSYLRVSNLAEKLTATRIICENTCIDDSISYLPKLFSFSK